MRRILEFFAKHWIRLVAALFVGATIMVIHVALQSQITIGTSETKIFPWDKARYYVDGLFIAGMIVSFVSILIVLSSFGSFNFLTFYVKRKKKDNGYKENYYEYTERTRLEKASYRSIFLPYLIVGLVFIATSIILYFIAVR